MLIRRSSLPLASAVAFLVDAVRARVAFQVERQARGDRILIGADEVRPVHPRADLVHLFRQVAPAADLFHRIGVGAELVRVDAGEPSEVRRTGAPKRHRPHRAVQQDGANHGDDDGGDAQPTKVLIDRSNVAQVVRREGDQAGQIHGQRPVWQHLALNALEHEQGKERRREPEG